MTGREVACVHRSRRVAFTEDGQELPIIRLSDSFGDECDDIDDAVTCVAGPDRDGKWLCIDFRCFDKAPVH